MDRIILIIALLGAVALSGCGITSGTVTERVHEPYSEGYMIFFMSVSCGQNCTMSVPIMYFYQDSEDWILKLKDKKGHTGKVYVSKSDWDHYEPGSFYEDPDAAKKDPTFIKRESHRPEDS